jgi:hypothetical protein
VEGRKKREFALFSFALGAFTFFALGAFAFLVLFFFALASAKARKKHQRPSLVDKQVFSYYKTTHLQRSTTPTFENYADKVLQRKVVIFLSIA